MTIETGNTTQRTQPHCVVEVERIEPFDIVGFMRTIWRGKFLILMMTVLAVCVAGYYAFAIATPRFAAIATLRVTAAGDPGVAVDASVTGPVPDQHSLNTEVAILQSRHLLESVVHELDLIHDPVFNRYLTPVATWSVTGLRNRVRHLLSGTVEVPPSERAILDKTVDNLAAAMSVDMLRNTYIFRITATTESPATSARIANTLAALYLADQVAAKQTATETTVGWLSDRVHALQWELERKETEINDIIVANRANDAGGLDALSRQSIEAGDRLVAARRALGEAEARLTNAATSGADRQRLQADIQRFSNQTVALRAFQARIDAQLTDQSANLVRLQQLRREADATRVLYDTFLVRLQETRIQRGLHGADSRILSLATPGTYVAPRKSLILLIAALLGVVCGVAAVLVSQTRRKGFASAHDLAEATGLPVLAQIPRRKTRGRGQLADVPDTGEIADAIRDLRSALLLATPDRVPQVILFTASTTDDDTATHCIALAHHLAVLGKHVLLVEADLRNTDLQLHVDCVGCDLGQVLSGDVALSAAICRDPRLAADILLGHETRQNPADLFSTENFGTFIRQIRESYDFIILHAPPVLDAPDARLLARHANAILYGVSWQKSDKRLILKGKRALTATNAAISGFVLSGVDKRHAITDV